jgi:hypothetical protein
MTTAGKIISFDLTLNNHRDGFIAGNAAVSTRQMSASVLQLDGRTGNAFPWRLLGNAAQKKLKFGERRRRR